MGRVVGKSNGINKLSCSTPGAFGATFPEKSKYVSRGERAETLGSLPVIAEKPVRVQIIYLVSC